MRAAWIASTNQRTDPVILIEIEVRIKINRGVFVPHGVREKKALQTLREGMPFVRRESMRFALFAVECPADSGHSDPLTQSLRLFKIQAKALHHGRLDQ